MKLSQLLHTVALVKLIIILVFVSITQPTSIKPKFESQCWPFNECPLKNCCCLTDFINEKNKIQCNFIRNDGEPTFPEFPERVYEAKETEFSQVEIRYQFPRLPSKAFDGLKIEVISFMEEKSNEEAIYTEMSIQADSFSGLTGLRELEFVGFQVKSVETNALEPLRDTLKLLRIRQCALITIDSMLLNNPLTSLDRLELINNPIRNLNENWFVNLPKLSHLTISNEIYKDKIEAYPDSNFFRSNPLLRLDIC